MQDYGYFLDAFQLGGQLSNVHPYILCEDWWAEGSRQMVSYEDLTILAYLDLIYKMHLGDRQPYLRIHDLLELPRDLF